MKTTQNPDSQKFQAQLRIMLAADQAEARGDVAGALRLVGRDFGGDDFWRPWRRRTLLALEELGSDAPDWVRARWILNQACSARGVPGTHREAIGQAAAARGCDAQDLSREWWTKIVDHDWVFRQHFLYDLGGLAHFIRTTARTRLLGGAGIVETWAETPMGGYRLLGVDPPYLGVEDLRTGERHRVIDLGACTTSDLGECLVGRLVGCADGELFDGTTMRVPEALAQRIAHDPGDWLTHFVATAADSRHGVYAGDCDFELLTDVLQHPVMFRALFDDLGHPMSTSRVVNAVGLAERGLGLVEAAAECHPDDLPRRIWPLVGAALFEPRAATHLRRRVRPEQAPLWEAMAEQLPEPMRSRCLGIPAGLQDVA